MTKSLLEASFERNSKYKLRLKVAPEIEEFFKKYYPDQRDSTRWRGHKFYTNNNYGSGIPQEVKEYLDDCHSDYGGQIIKSGYFNTALLRTVGLSSEEGKEFIVPSDEAYSDENMKQAIQKLKDFVIITYKKFIKPLTIKCVLTVEEVI